MYIKIMSNITIEQVISYLTSDKKQVEDNLYRLIFENNAYRIDTIKELKTNIETHNISLYSSILCCLDESFIKLIDTEQIKYIQEFINKINVDYHADKLYTKYNFKRYKIKRDELLQEIQYYKNTINVLRFMTYYFDINIFVLELDKNKLYCHYNDNKYNKYKTNIILCKLNDTLYEPIQSKNCINYDCNNSLLKYILNDYKNIIQTYSNTSFVIKSDEETNMEIIEELKKPEPEPELEPELELEQVLGQELKQVLDQVPVPELEQVPMPVPDQVPELEQVQVPVQELKQVLVHEQKNVYYSIKMKLGEIQEIALKYNIKIEKQNGNKTKLKTKQELINELDKKI